MSHAELIMDYLLAGNTLTHVEAYDLFKCNRLAARIYDLRSAIRIRADRLKLPNGKTVAQYRLEA